MDMPEVAKFVANEQLNVTLGWERKTLDAEAFSCWIKLNPMHFQPNLIRQQYPTL